MELNFSLLAQLLLVIYQKMSKQTACWLHPFTKQEFNCIFCCVSFMSKDNLNGVVTDQDEKIDVIWKGVIALFTDQVNQNKRIQDLEDNNECKLKYQLEHKLEFKVA